MANFLLQGTRKQNLSSNARLNISDSNDFWNDCETDEKHSEKNPNLINKINGHVKQNTHQTSLFNKSNTGVNNKNENKTEYKTENTVMYNKNMFREKEKDIKPGLISKNTNSLKIMHTHANSNVNIGLNINTNTNSKKVIENEKTNLNYNYATYNCVINSKSNLKSTMANTNSNIGGNLTTYNTNSNTNSKFSNTNSNFSREKCNPKNLEKFLNTKYNTENNKKTVYEIVEKSIDYNNKPKSHNNVINKQNNEATIEVADEKTKFELLYEAAKKKNQYLQKIYDDRKKLEALKGLKDPTPRPKNINLNFKKNEEFSEKFSDKNRSLVNKPKDKNEKDNHEKLGYKSNKKEEIEIISYLNREVKNSPKLEVVSENKETKVIPEEKTSSYKNIDSARIEEYKNKISEINSLLYEKEFQNLKPNKDPIQHSASVDININSDRNKFNTNIDFINFEFDSDSELEVDKKEKFCN